MAIGDFFSGLGQRVGRGLTEIGGYDPMEQVSPEQARMRRQEGLSALQRSLGKSSAILSGDPRRMQLAEQQMQMAEQKKALRQFALDNPQYADMIKLQELGLDPRLAAGTTKPGSVERFGVYDQKTNKLIGTVLKTDTQRIGELEVSGYTVGQLRSPTIPTNKSPSMNTWAITNAAGDRVKDLVNPTQEELNAEIKAGNFVNKTPVLSTAGKGEAKPLGEIKGWSDEQGLQARAAGYNGLVNSGNRIIKNLYENPESVLTTGDVAQIFNQIGQEITAVTGLINRSDRNTFVNKADAEVKNNFAQLAKDTAITESQLLDFAYQIAKVRGQEGRGLSDQDFRNFQKIISAGRTAEEKAAALTNFIQGVKSEVKTDLDYERKIRTAQIERDPDNREANAVIQGIQDVYNVGFGEIQNPFIQQQIPATQTTNGIPRVRIKL